MTTSGPQTIIATDLQDVPILCPRCGAEMLPWRDDAHGMQWRVCTSAACDCRIVRLAGRA